MRRRAFTLVELLTVIAILAILYAIFFPAIIAVKNAALGYGATQGLRQLGQASDLYAADSDDTAPLAMYNSQTGLVAWFGARQADGTFDAKQGILTSYFKGKQQKDGTLNVKPWLGDGSGFGYNWGYIGSDFNTKSVYVDFPNCRNAVHYSEIKNPSTTITFATSSYYFGSWLPKGDGANYDFGFIDPPRLWNGSPDVDFRHMGTKTVDAAKHTVTSSGHAFVLRADGSVKPKKQDEITDDNFVP